MLYVSNFIKIRLLSLLLLLLLSLFFSWTYSTFKKGSKGILSLSDIYDPPKGDESNFVTDKLEKYQIIYTISIFF